MNVKIFRRLALACFTIFEHGLFVSIKVCKTMRIYQTLEIWILPSGREEGGGGGGWCLQGNLWYSPPASMTSRLASGTFKMASKVFIKETDKSRKYRSDFLDLEILRFLLP